MRPWRLAGPARGMRRLGAGDEVVDFDGVADGPDVRVARAHVLIDDDAAEAADFEPRLPRKACLGTDADGHDDDVEAAVSPLLRRRPGGRRAIGLELRYGHAEAEVDAVRAQFLVERRGHLRVGGAHDLFGELDESDFETALAEGLGHLETDVAAADDEGAARPCAQRGREMMASMSAMFRSVMTSGESAPGMGRRTGSAPGLRMRAS